MGDTSSNILSYVVHAIVVELIIQTLIVDFGGWRTTNGFFRLQTK